LQEDSSAGKYYVKIAQYYASTKDYEVREEGRGVGYFYGPARDSFCSLNTTPDIKME